MKPVYNMELYPLFLKHPVICTDSRSCPEASIFFALKGDNFNGNAFARQALAKGCAFAVVDEAAYANDKRCILVEDVLKTLQDLACFHREQLKTKIIGITGTNGKTTSKELIAAVLQKRYKTLYTEGNLNNHIGVPLTLLRLTGEHEIAVIEMGANHPGEIRQLCKLAQPDLGIITNVGKAHLEGFGSFEGVKRSKAELYEFIALRDGRIFINADNEQLVEMARKAGVPENKWEKYGITPDGKCPVTGKLQKDGPTLKMLCRTNRNDFEVHTQLIGDYNAENVLAALSIGHYFGISDQEIATAVGNYIPTNKRSQLTVTPKNTLVIDAYNANPDSMKQAVRNFATIEAENKYLILGDMFELGNESNREHQSLIETIKSLGFTKVLLVGPEFKATTHDFLAFNTVSELIDALKEQNIEKAWILIKASRGMKLEQITEYL